MFENILIRRHENGQNPIDIGRLIEALIFYDNVNLVLDRASLMSLLSTAGPDPIIQLAMDGFLKITFIKSTLGVGTDSTSGIEINDFVAMEVVGFEDRRWDEKEALLDLFERSLGKSWDTKKKWRKFIEISKIRSINDGVSHPRGVSGMFYDDLDDQDFIEQSINDALCLIDKDFKIPAGWRFKTIKIENGFIVDTNFDFSHLSALGRKNISLDFKATPALLLSTVQEAYGDLVFASKYMCEFSTSPATSKIISRKIKDILYRSERNNKEIDAFQEHIIGKTHAISDAINNGSVTIADSIKLVQKSRKFKKWKQSLHPDSSLIQEYYKEVTSGSWVEKLPGKAARFSFFTGSGILLDAALPTGIGTAAGLTLGSIDSFVIDRILRGWKPNQYIDNILRPALKI